MSEGEFIWKSLPPGMSTDDVPLLHKKILEKIAELAEPAIRNWPPFDQIEKFKLTKAPYMEVYESLSGDEKEKITQWRIAMAKCVMCGDLYCDNELVENLRRFDRKHSKIGGINFVSSVKEFDGGEVLREVMRCRMPEFRPDRRLVKLLGSRKGVYVYSRNFLGNSSLAMIYKLYSKNMNYFECAIAIGKPFFMIELLAPWATYVDPFDYCDNDTCRNAVNKALDVADIVLPVFEQKMKEAFALTGEDG